MFGREVVEVGEKIEMWDERYEMKGFCGSMWA